ncbi:MAG: GGDEF domain-containing protein [Candidatus Theseobacter exili]|nr:GGDEF domain-containing protein [Candidatus Theseobacter exili]
MKNKKIPSVYNPAQNIGHLIENNISLDFVSAIAGDRCLSIAEKEKYKQLKKKYGLTLHTELLFSVTHTYFKPKLARELWKSIIKHKYDMSNVLKRNVRITVASLDFLTNLNERLDSPVLISEMDISLITDQAAKDGLTRLFNHTTFYEKLYSELNRYKRHGIPFSLVMLDVDDFKQINDLKGHQTGDVILAEIASLLMMTTRDLDICARYGGEEFSVILPHMESDEAFSIAERLRHGMEDIVVEETRATISAGIASCPKNSIDAAGLVKSADTALYQAKQNGKNIVVISK